MYRSQKYTVEQTGAKENVPLEKKSYIALYQKIPCRDPF